jgi:hypothetical protein
VRDVQLFFSIKHLDAFVGLLISLISIWEQGAPRRGKEKRQKLVCGTLWMHTALRYPFHMDEVCGFSITIGTSLITKCLPP